MSLALYISEALNQTNAFVFSPENPVPVSFPDLVFGDSIPSQIVLVDGQGAVAGDSGAAGSTVVVSIGTLNASVWSNSNWTIASNPAGWTGTLNPNGDDLLALFDGRTEMYLVIQIRVTDTQGNSRTYTAAVKIVQNMNPSGASTGVPDNRDGEMAIANGSDSVTVSGLALSAAPRRVIINIQKPDGGSNIFGTVISDSITADGFSVDLSGATDTDGYKLEYQLIFG